MRLFKWHEGKLVKALREKQWILLDEINFAFGRDTIYSTKQSLSQKFRQAKSTS